MPALKIKPGLTKHCRPLSRKAQGRGEWIHSLLRAGDKADQGTEQFSALVSGLSHILDLLFC